jgi:hypothetical protein
MKLEHDDRIASRLDVDAVRDIEHREALQQLGAMVDVVFEEMERNPMAGIGDGFAVPLAGIALVQLRLIGEEALEAGERSTELALQVVARAGGRPNVGVQVAVLHIARQPTISRVRHVDEYSARVPQILLGRPVQFVVGEQIDDRKQMFLNRLPVWRDVEPGERCMLHSTDRNRGLP